MERASVRIRRDAIMTSLGRRKEKDAMELENGVTFAFPIHVLLWKVPQRHMDVQCVHPALALQSSYPIDLIKPTSSFLFVGTHSAT